MLLTQITCFADQTVAEKMSGMAQRIQPDPVLTEQAVDEALSVFQETSNRDVAISAGLDFIVDRALSRRRHDDHLTAIARLSPPADARRAFAWVESWGFILVSLGVSLGMLLARAAGWWVP